MPPRFSLNIDLTLGVNAPLVTNQLRILKMGMVCFVEWVLAEAQKWWNYK
jgi:hypothetical protein